MALDAVRVINTLGHHRSLSLTTTGADVSRIAWREEAKPVEEHAPDRGHLLQEEAPHKVSDPLVPFLEVE